MIDFDNSKSIEFTELCTFFGYYADGEEMSEWSDPEASPQQSNGSLRRRRTADHGTDSHDISSESDLGKTADYGTRKPGISPATASATTQALTTTLAAGAPHLTALEVINIFKTLDLNGDGEISHAEFIRGCKSNPSIAEKLGMPAGAQSQNNRSYQLAFGKIDHDHSKTIDLMEMLGYYGHLGLERTQLHSLLLLCGYEGEAIRAIYQRSGVLSGSYSATSEVHSPALGSGVSSATLPVDSSNSMFSTALSTVPARRAHARGPTQRQEFLDRMKHDELAGDPAVTENIGGHDGRTARGSNRDTDVNASQSMSSSDGLSHLRNSIFEKSLAWLDHEMQSQSSQASPAPSGQIAISASVGIRASAHYTPPPVDGVGPARGRMGKSAGGQGDRRNVRDGSKSNGEGVGRVPPSSSTQKSRDGRVLVMGAGGRSEYTVLKSKTAKLLQPGSIDDWEFRPPSR